MIEANKYDGLGNLRFRFCEPLRGVCELDLPSGPWKEYRGRVIEGAVSA